MFSDEKKTKNGKTKRFTVQKNTPTLKPVDSIKPVIYRTLSASLQTTHPQERVLPLNKITKNGRTQRSPVHYNQRPNWRTPAKPVIYKADLPNIYEYPFEGPRTNTEKIPRTINHEVLPYK